MRVLITGSNGFCGRNIVELLGEKHEFIKVTRDSKYNIRNLDTLMEIDDVDVVIHAAAKTFVPESYDDPYGFYNFNINSCLNVAEYCRIKKVNRLIYLNSYPYGRPDYCPIDEKHPISLHSPYNKSKFISEEVLTNYLEGITNVVSLRLFNLYGKHQRDDFIIPSIINQAINGDSVIVNDLVPKRDYMCINDLVLLIETIINSEADSDVYNVGSGVSYSVLEIINIVGDILDKELIIKSRGISRPNEIMDCYANISKATSLFPWSPKYSLRSGLIDYINY